MSIFGNRVNNMNSNHAEYSHVMPTSEGLDQILTESAKECYQLRAGMYISDVMMEEAVFEGSSSSDILLEGFTNDIWVKIKNMFKKLWDTLKSWFGKVKRFLELFFSSGKSFVDKFEKEIRAKSAKGFEYEGFKYTPEKGVSAAGKVLTVAMTGVNTYAGGLDENAAKVASNHVDYLKAKKDFHDEYNVEDEKESLLKACGADSLDELQEELAKAFRNGETEKEKFEAFSGNSKEDMMSGIKTKDKAIKLVEDAESKLDQIVTRAIKAIDSAANKFKGEEYSKIAPYVSFSTEMMRYCVTLVSTTSRVMVDAVKEGSREFESILKSFLRFKAVKDSFSNTDEFESSSSILESAMRSL